MPNTAIKDVVKRWNAGFDAHQLDAMTDLYTADALFQGFGREVLAGRDAVRTYYDEVPDYRRAKVEFLHEWTVGEQAAGGFAVVTFFDPDGWRAQVHLSLVLRREDDGWRILQYHVSRLEAEH